jgi:nicotinate phosphoribosyltransferase
MPGEAATSALLTDLYELTMADGYLRSGLAENRAVFSLSFRHTPFGGAYAVACGLSRCLDALAKLRFTRADREYLEQLCTPEGKRFFGDELLDWVRSFRLHVDVDAVPEGTLVFPSEPLLRVEGPLAEAQLLEPLLLNFLNFETLVATKSARVCEAARGAPILEFGLRRAQGTDGALGASRAAFVGGCAATSNVLAGRLFDIPVRGTHAHSWVMAFGNEQRAFEAFAELRPDDSVLLVDTYDTRSGIEHAIGTARSLAERGERLSAIRLDSGDLGALSRLARARLDAAGLGEVGIIASGDLDEYEIARLVDGGAPIDVWGVGTRLVTAFDQPALDGVYKLTAVEVHGQLEARLKLSDTAQKGSLPGRVETRRFFSDGEPVGDVLVDELAGEPAIFRLVHGDGTPFDEHPAQGFAPPLSDAAAAPNATKSLLHTEDLLVPVLRDGSIVYDVPSAAAARRRTQDQLSRLAPRHRRLKDPEPYPVAFDERLIERRAHLAEQIREVWSLPRNA